MELRLLRFVILLITICSHSVVAQDVVDTRNIVENLLKEFQVLKNRIKVWENIVNGQNDMIKRQSANVERLEKIIKTNVDDASPLEIIRNHGNGLNSPSMNESPTNESRIELSLNGKFIGPRRTHNFKIKSSLSPSKTANGKSRMLSRKCYSYFKNFLFLNLLR